MNRAVILARRPQAEVGLDDFRLVSWPLASLADGDVLIRNDYLSLDPYMRRRMVDARSYAEPHPLHAVMCGETVATVVESRNRSWRVGDRVTARSGWQEYEVTNGAGLTRLPDAEIPASAYLGAIGMPGITAWYGLNQICRPRAGQTIAVSAASGAVGSVVGQLAALQGALVIGVAGGPEKCSYVRDELGFGACVDYKQASFKDQLRDAAPRGIDCYFDNVGGFVTDEVMALMNDFGRIAMCGVMASVEGSVAPMANPTLILRYRLSIQGFIISEHREFWAQASKNLRELYKSGHLKYRETVAHGLENAPAAFIGMLKGKNFGKQLVKLS